ncbi:MAG: tetratricopeptide repeat protein [Thermoflexales bacterium]|nr:tetratricopeptide repeat protein [Thermoflexales bacterium]
MDDSAAQSPSRYLSPAQSDLLAAPDDTAVRSALISLLQVVSTYLPRHVVRTELQHLDRTLDPISGEFLRGALAFADISGFTALSEKLSIMGREGAEQVTEIVNRYFRRMLGIVFEHGGDVFKFGGDALLIYFPDGDQPGAVAALTASWHMQQAMSELAEVKTTLGTFPLRMKIGLNTGSFFAGRLGTPDDRQFMVTGDNVNATARAESLSVAGQILVTPMVYAALSGPASTFQFAPGPNDHYLLTALLTAPKLSITPWPQQLLAPDTPLASLVTALDRLTPFLPNGLLPRLMGDAAQPRASGEHRLVGTLFCNFFGASELIAQLGTERADEIAAHLNRYLIKMHTAIAQYGGVISKIDLYDHGDKIMAIFGAPIAHENDAERTLRAALDMQASVRDLAVMKIEQSIGVTSGVVFAGLVGSDERREYTVMGDDVNLAARLMSAAPRGDLLLSSSIRRKVTAFYEVADRGTVKVKGKSQPIPIFSVVGPRAQPEPVRGIRGLHSPLVGRDVELATLRDLAAQIRSGSNTGRLLVLTGDAGLGKSRLINELRAQIAVDECRCLESHCLSYTQNVSYSAFTDIVRSALGLNAGDSEAEGWTKLRQQLAELLPADVCDDILPYLASFLSWRLPEALAERVTYLEGEALQRQVIRAVVTVLEALAARHPMLLVFDDLHWADSASLALLERTLTLVERSPILIALLYRPDRTHGSWALGENAARIYPAQCVSLRIPPLDVPRGEDQQLVRNLLQLAELPAELPPLIARGEGNPFYIEEIIRALIDAGAIVYKDERWQPTRSLGLSTVPDSLQGIIMARIDRLIEDARRTLQLASVVGRTFQYLALNWLASAAALAAQLDGSLSTLQRAELIREQTRLPELEYGFAQAMFRDVAYESLLLRDRRVYHRLVAQQLEETHPDQIEEVYELLAHHYGLSDDRKQALTYLIKAGEKTRAAYANKEAIEFFTQAALLADHLGTPADNAAAAEGLGDVFYHVGQYEDALACFTRALSFRTKSLELAALYRRMGAVYEKRGDYEAALTQCASGLKLLGAEHVGSVERARLLTLECRVHHQQGQFEKAIEDGEQALTIIDDSSNYQEIAQAHNELGNAHEGYSQIERAIWNYERGLLILERIGDEHGASKIYNNLAIIYSQTDLARCANYLEQALDTMRRLGNVPAESTILQNLGIVQYNRGDFTGAYNYYQQSLAIKTRLGDNQGIADCHINLGEVCRALGDLAAGISHLETALEIGLEINSEQTEAECYRQLAECYLESGNLLKALDASNETLNYARISGDRTREGIIYRVLGKIHQQQDSLREALEDYSRSVATLQDLNQEFDLGMTLIDYSQALLQNKEVSEARARLIEAQAIFERLNVPAEKTRVAVLLEQIQ